MNTKNVLVFAAGALVAYFVIKQMEKRKAAEVSAEEAAAAAEEPQGSPGHIDPKVTDCQAQLAEQLKMVRVTDIEGYKTQFMESCLNEIITGALPGGSRFDESGGSAPVLDSSLPLDSQLGIQAQ